MTSPKNKTIDLNKEQVDRYLALCSTEYKGVDSVICGDCMQVMDGIPRGSVDLLIVDPPYNINKRFGSEKFGKISSERYAEYTEAWLDKALPLLKPTASVYVCCDWFSGMVIGPLLEKKLILRNRITWQREKGRGSSQNWKNSMEDVWFATVSDRYTFALGRVKQKKQVVAPYREDGEAKDWFEECGQKFRYTCPSNFWDDITVPFWSMSENTVHPTQKPEKLMAKIILAGSDEGDLVFDPFGGSGTTAVTACKLGRHYLTVESDPKYCATAAYRLENVRLDSSIQGYENGVFLSRNGK